MAMSKDLLNGLVEALEAYDGDLEQLGDHAVDPEDQARIAAKHARNASLLARLEALLDEEARREHGQRRVEEA